MIGFACPWCDHEVSLTRQALADDTAVCAECSTRVDLSVDPATAVLRVDPSPASLPLAA